MRKNDLMRADEWMRRMDRQLARVKLLAVAGVLALAAYVVLA